MKLQLSCDRCGLVAGPDQIPSNFNERDLCKPCQKAETIEGLKLRYKLKMKWLADTHHAELRKIDEQIQSLEKQ